VKIAGSGAATKSDKPVEVPNVEWKPSVTAVQADPVAVPPGNAKRAYLTFIPGQDVKDGDTVKARGPGGKVDDCRIDWIDAPESPKDWKNDPGQPGGVYAAKTLKALIGDKQATVRVTQEATAKNHGRPMCQIEVEGVNVSEEMIKKGAAWLYREYGPKDPDTYERLAKQELQNQINGVGIFEDWSNERPSNYRHRQPKTK
jgi:endonuclease YncB( thermonuclease family)